MVDLDADERSDIIDRYEGLRVPDVVDALDYLEFDINDQQYLMDASIKPVFRDTETYAHAGRGFAYTARYRPSRDPEGPVRGEAIDDRPGMWYDNLSPAPYLDEIRDGDFVVVDVVHKSELGFMGSRNTLEYIAAGANGMVTNSGCRDIEELVRQGFPVYSKYISPQPGQIVLDDTQIPVQIGGVDVQAGDFLVADASGIVVVPIEYVEEVADVANAVQAEDSGARRDLYEAVGLNADDTVN